MKRLQIMIEEDMDLELARLALATGQSKAALIRKCVRDQLDKLPPLSEDPLSRIVGAYSFEPGDIDAIVYG